MPKSLNDKIREEFKIKLDEKEVLVRLNERALKTKVLINALESILPDKDWKEGYDEKTLLKKNSNKLINNLTSQMQKENEN